MLRINELFPPAITSEYKAEESTRSVKHSSTNEELTVKSLFQHNNAFTAKDGRTYQYMDDAGKYISARVSPYSPNIINNIEPGISNIVIALINKGYLTCSSCQGHPDRKYRFVTIAFNTEQQLLRFKQNIQSFNLPIHFKEHNIKDPNCEFKVVYQQDKFVGRKLSMDDYQGLSNNYTDIIKYFNLMFFREYSTYYLLEVRIASGPDAKNIIEYISRRPYYGLMYVLREYYTKLLYSKLTTDLPEYEDKL